MPGVYFCSMHYIEISIPVTDEETAGILIAGLAVLGFEGFEELTDSIRAFTDEENYDEPALQAYLEEQHLSFEKAILPKQNWNEVWESSFEPVIVDDYAGIRAGFHPPIQGVTHEIVITPKMSFGTGHHATTYMMMQLIRTLDLAGYTVFDFGTGTGILAILAEKAGSGKITAIDIDDWCIENAAENIINNNCSNIDLYQSSTLPKGQTFDIMIANINKHIILGNFNDIAEAVVPGGDILLSGLLIADEPEIQNVAIYSGWKHIKTLYRGDWAAFHYRKCSLK